MKTLIQNTRVVSPDVDLPKADILIDNGIIADIAESIPATNCDNVINGAGLIIQSEYHQAKNDSALSIYRS